MSCFQSGLLRQRCRYGVGCVWVGWGGGGGGGETNSFLLTWCLWRRGSAVKPGSILLTANANALFRLPCIWHIWMSHWDQILLVLWQLMSVYMWLIPVFWVPHTELLPPDPDPDPDPDQTRPGCSLMVCSGVSTDKQCKMAQSYRSVLSCPYVCMYPVGNLSSCVWVSLCVFMSE